MAENSGARGHLGFESWRSRLVRAARGRPMVRGSGARSPWMLGSGGGQPARVVGCVYQSRYSEMARPVVDLGRARSQTLASFRGDRVGGADGPTLIGPHRRTRWRRRWRLLIRTTTTVLGRSVEAPLVRLVTSRVALCKSDDLGNMDHALLEIVLERLVADRGRHCCVEPHRLRGRSHAHRR